MGVNVDPLVVGRVIGDVVDMFVPTVSMSVYYGSKHVNNGCDIKPSIAAAPPRVTITGYPNELYTLVSVHAYTSELQDRRIKKITSSAFEISRTIITSC